MEDVVSGVDNISGCGFGKNGGQSQEVAYAMKGYEVGRCASDIEENLFEGNGP